MKLPPRDRPFCPARLLCRVVGSSGRVEGKRIRLSRRATLRGRFTTSVIVSLQRLGLNGAWITQSKSEGVEFSATIKPNGTIRLVIESAATGVVELIED